MNRSWWFLLAALCGVLLASGCIWHGPGVLSIDDLIENPVSVWMLFVAPSLGLILAVSFLALPRLVGWNLLIFIAAWGVAEGVFALLLVDPLQIEGEPEAISGDGYYISAPRVGYALKADNTARHRRLIEGKPAFDVTYEIDEYGRREVARPADPAADFFVLCFGGSNTFGEGLPQGSTLPDFIQAEMPSVSVYNYGVHGYGIAQMLDVIATRDLGEEVPQQRGIALFYFIPAHMWRLVGASNVATSWGRVFSYYRLDKAGRLERIGGFGEGRRWLTFLYGLLNYSNVLAYLNVVLPLRFSDSDYELAAAIVGESANRLAEAFDFEGLYVVLSPTVGPEDLEISGRLARALRARQISVIDLTDAFDLTERRYRIADHDKHQSAEANRIVAERIVRHLMTDRRRVKTEQY